MSIGLSDGFVTVQLPADLDWANEYGQEALSQSVEWSVDGAAIVDVCAKQAGISIVLEGGDARAWVAKSVVDQIKTWSRVPGQELTLSLRGQTMNVIFDHGAGALSAKPVHEVSDAPADWPHRVTLKFLTV